MYDKMVAAKIEGKTKNYEVQRIAEQIEQSKSLHTNHSTVLQVNKEESLLPSLKAK